MSGCTSSNRCTASNPSRDRDHPKALAGEADRQRLDKARLVFDDENDRLRRHESPVGTRIANTEPSPSLD